MGYLPPIPTSPRPKNKLQDTCHAAGAHRIPSMPRVALHTLGCKLNHAETGAIGRGFRERGFDVVEAGTPADVAVINTCTVTDEAERKCRQAIRRVLRARPDTFVIVTGCYAQLRPDDLAAIPGVDLVLGSQEKGHLFRYVDSFRKVERTQVHVSCIDQARDFGPAHAAGERTRAFLKVQDGCDYSCSFCTIPRARGRSRSQTVAGAVAQARAIAEEGFREIVLSGVNIGLFGKDTGESLLGLLRSLDAVEGVTRYRISSIEPNLLTDDIIDFVAGSRAFQPHFHVPLQSGDDEVLGRMRRRYRRSAYAERVERIARAMPDAAIGADVIVGFPAETADRFLGTVSFLESLPVAYLHAFTYSERPDTPAVRELGRTLARVPKEDRSRRNRALRMLSERKHAEFVRRHLGTSRSVLWEEPGPGGVVEGYTDNYIRVRADVEGRRAGSVEAVTLVDLSEDGAALAGGPTLPVLG
jgi:threonylcarbamoyladenosine tRNA methylthiotransferase MtaB